MRQSLVSLFPATRTRLTAAYLNSDSLLGKVLASASSLTSAQAWALLLAVSVLVSNWQSLLAPLPGLLAACFPVLLKLKFLPGVLLACLLDWREKRAPVR